MDRLTLIRTFQLAAALAIVLSAAGASDNHAQAQTVQLRFKESPSTPLPLPLMRPEIVPESTPRLGQRRPIQQQRRPPTNVGQVGGLSIRQAGVQSPILVAPNQNTDPMPSGNSLPRLLSPMSAIDQPGQATAQGEPRDAVNDRGAASAFSLTPFLLQPIRTAQAPMRGSRRIAQATEQGPTAPLDQDENHLASIAETAAKITPSMIEERARSAADNADLTDDDKARVAELYETAESNFDRALKFERRAGDYRQGIESANRRAQHNSIVLRQLEIARPIRPETQDVKALEEMLASQRDALSALKDRKIQLDEDLTTRSSRCKEIRQRLVAIDEEIERAKSQAEAAPASGEPSAISQAKQTEALCHFRAAFVEKPALLEELRFFDAEAALDLLQNERNLVTRQVELWNDQLQLTEAALNDARYEEAGTAVESAAHAENSVPDVLRPIAEVSVRYAERSQELTRDIQSAENRLEEITNQADEVRQTFSAMRAKVNSVGLPASVGAMLRNHRAHLPDSHALDNSRLHRQSEIDLTQLAIFDLDEVRSRLIDMDDAAASELAALSTDRRSLLTAQNLEIANSLLRSRRELLDTVYRNQSTYFRALTDISIEEEQLSKLSNEFRGYIEERVLWIRSHPPIHNAISPKFWRSELESKRALLDWPQVGPALTKDATSAPITYFAAAIFIGLLIVIRPLLSAQLGRIAARARGGAYSYFSPSLFALCINVIASLFGPALLFFFAWRLALLREPATLANALAIGCKDGAFTLLTLSFFSNVFAKDGLADAHFDWSPHVTTTVRRNLSWLRLILPLAVIIGAVLYTIQGTSSAGIIHRCLFVVAGSAVSLFTWRIMHPKRGLPSDYLARHEGGWLERLQSIWFWGLVSVPLLLSGLTLLGFTYTANELAWRGFRSFAILGLVLVLHGLFMRLLLVHRRQLSVEAAKERYAEQQRKIAEEAAAKEPDAAKLTSETTRKDVIADLPGVSVTSSGIVMEEDPLADLHANSAQSRRLVTTLLVGATVIMIWLTWHNVLPALTFLERWPLWNSTKEVTDVITLESGLTEARTHEIVDPVTIADLILALFSVVLGVVAARDIPGLLELAVLKRLPLENSVRYAITTICSYLLFFVGIMVACTFIGLRWQQIQWMATALTFGLAFGLQEMFANFVAGIIILFERPIRVGDIVTIDEVTGVISRVRMRATTVTNFDRKDYIVPNKDFITGRLLNWTLSDKVNRLTVKVGVAYGSDVDLAKEKIIDLARRHPIVVDEPPPMATFEEFGDSSLNLVLRCFISMQDMPMRLEVIDQLHGGIDAAFRAANIEIAFPQHDLRVRELPQSFGRAA